MSLTINISGKLMDFECPKVMGIINVTPDSFYSGSRAGSAVAVAERAADMLAKGADILDIGGYSSRPGAEDISADDEYRRLALGLEAVRKVAPDAVVSVDTFRADVARRCVEDWGVQIINDIGGGTLDPDMWPVVVSLRVAYILMHMRGTPSTMSSMCDYSDVTAEVISDLAFKTDRLRDMGVADIIIDPGFGFAKNLEQNFEMLDHFEEFGKMGMPVLAGMSRKSMIWRALDTTPEESLYGTVALHTVALMKGADIIRVHDVGPAVDTVRLLQHMDKKK